MTKFNKDEISFIESHLDRANSWIGIQLNRSKNSIDKKVCQLKLKKIYNQKKHNDLSNSLPEKTLAYCLGVLASDGYLLNKKNRKWLFYKKSWFKLCY